jgi:hypothetical protein
MEWVEQAEAYIGKHGWGARGKSLGISRMYGDNDKPMFRKEKLVASQRPRGVLSGFLAIVPTLGYAVYLPPIAAKMGPMRIRMRLSPTLLAEGAILSAYCLCANRSEFSQKTLILDDVLLWHEKPVWSTTVFKIRWDSMMSEFRTEHFKPMTELQGVKIDFASYVPLASFVDSPPDPTKVVEFVPNSANTKRIVWIPAPNVAVAVPVATQHVPKAERKTEPNVKGGQWLIAKKELGPDVFSVWRVHPTDGPSPKGDDERLGLALIRTLAISRAMRLNQAEDGSTNVRAEYNKQFDKWEIQEVQEKK